jgi:hypothetical protein
MPGCSPPSFVTLTILLVAVSSAADASSNAQLIATPLVASSVGRWHLTGPNSLAGAVEHQLQLSQVHPRPAERPRLLIPMYVSFAALQAMDAHSTMKAIDRGYGEVNPLVAPSTRNGAAMAAMKVAVTASVIVCTERLWRHNRVAAVVTMIAINSAYAAIVAHNYRTVSH